MKVKKISKEANEIIENYCKINDLNGQAENITTIINIVINVPKYIEFVNGDKIEFIKDTVCNYFDVEPADIYIKSRRDNKPIIRQITQYLARLNTPISLDKIGKKTGGKDHATVYNSCRKIEKLINNPQTPYNKKLAEDIRIINEMLKI